MDPLVKVIEDLVIQLKSKVSRIDELEKELKDIKKQKKNLEETVLPDTMSELGVTSVTLRSSEVITVKPFFYARLPEQTDGFFSWLRESGFGGLIKEKVEIYPGDNAELLLSFLKEFAIGYESKSTVHWKTLEAWYRECVEAGLKLPIDLFPHYEGRIAKIRE
jgi:hypothetical protein